MTEATYLLPIGDTIKAAWDKVKGSKGSIWAALLITLIIIFGLGFFDGIMTVVAPKVEPAVAIIVQVLGFLLQMGVLYLGIRRAQDLPITYRNMFRTFEGRITLRVIVLYILQILILLIPIALMMFGIIVFDMEGVKSTMLIIAGVVGIIGFVATVFITVRIMLSMGFVLDKGTNAWAAITQSFAATAGNFWRLVGIVIIQTLIILVSIIPVGIGLIWSLPFVYILYGTVYKNLTLNNLRTP